MATFVNDLVSLGTRSALRSAEDNRLTTADETCSYPVINGIPVILERTEAFFAESYFMYGKHLHQQQEMIHGIGQQFQDDILRKNVSQNFERALRINCNHTMQLMHTLEPLFSKEALLQISLQHQFLDIPYLKALRYLKRDWCSLPESDEQLRIINDCLSSAIGSYGLTGDDALVLGAGMGKIAWQLAGQFRKIYATDKSFSMAHLYSRLLKGEIINFFDINYNNIKNNIDSTRNLNASLSIGGYSPEDIERISNKILYFISDVCQLPLPDESVSCILSVYFTDVLPLKDYFFEIDRVLKKDGVFIHFGTLGYPFADKRHMLTAEDIKAWFFKYGYSVEMEKTVPSFHLPSFESIHNNRVDNWCFVARKKDNSSIPHSKPLTRDIVLGFTDKLEYMITGQLGNDKPAAFQLHNKSLNKFYESEEEIIDFVRLIDGKKTIGELFKEYGSIYEIDEAGTQKLMEVTRFLLKERIVKIINAGSI